MFCPKCKTEYREGFELCTDCNIKLVDKLKIENVLEEKVLLMKM